jgi:hypothetical protein
LAIDAEITSRSDGDNHETPSAADGLNKKVADAVSFDIDAGIATRHYGDNHETHETHETHGKQTRPSASH